MSFKLYVLKSEIKYMFKSNLTYKLIVDKYYCFYKYLLQIQKTNKFLNWKGYQTAILLQKIKLTNYKKKVKNLVSYMRYIQNTFSFYI